VHAEAPAVEAVRADSKSNDLISQLNCHGSKPTHLRRLGLNYAMCAEEYYRSNKQVPRRHSAPSVTAPKNPLVSMRIFVWVIQGKPRHLQLCTCSFNSKALGCSLSL
jgi:hypothetical protein